MKGALAIVLAVSIVYAKYFQPFCDLNLPSSIEVEANALYASAGIANCSYSQTGGGCRLPGCKSWSQGIFPSVYPNSSARANGGVPQAANLTLHTELIKLGAQQWIPDPDFDGNAVIDFEAWSPRWEDNTNTDTGYHFIGYQLLSLDLVWNVHPNYTIAEAEAAAKKEFEEAALNFFAETLKAARSVRPKAKWGFYGFPGYNGMDECEDTLSPQPQCGYNNPAIAASLRLQNDALAPLWEASTGIFPTAYLFEKPFYWSDAQWAYVNRKHISGLTNETVRLVQTYGPKDGSEPLARARPFGWAYYHSGDTLLTSDDMASLLWGSYQPPLADGPLLWGSPGRSGGKYAEGYLSYLNATEAPLAKQLMGQVAACSSKSCSGHGACASLTPPPLEEDLSAPGVPAAGAPCVCDPGYSGPSCASN